MTKYVFYALSFLIGTALHAQEKEISNSLRVGIGSGFLSAGDMIAANLQGSYDFYHSPSWATSLAVAIGVSNTGVQEKIFYSQAEYNLLFSPYGRKGVSDFRFGGGLAYYRVNETILSFEGPRDDEIDRDYVFERRDAIGLNFMAEKIWALSETNSLALAVYAQPYFNSDSILGISLKFGMSR